MSQNLQEKEIKKLANALEDCHIDDEPCTEDLAKQFEFTDTLNPKLLSKWPKPKMRVPAIFLHKTVDFAQHSKKLLQLRINYYQPYLGTSYTRIFCHTFNDHKAMQRYFEKNRLPFHTFGHPNKKKMRVIIRGLPKETDLNKLLIGLKAADIPVVRVHKLRVKNFAKDRDILVLAVVPFTIQGRKLLQLKKAFGREVILERPIEKTKQCHRCQKWGHSQRYCHGEVKCVKCAGDHYSKKCTRDKEVEPPTCANCGGNHTASYRECFYCPDSHEYKKNKRSKLTRVAAPGPTPPTKRVLVTLKNHDKLYRKINNIPKHNEAVPF